MRYFLEFCVFAINIFSKNRDILIIETHSNSGSNTRAVANELINQNIHFKMISYPERKASDNRFKYKVKVFLFHLKVSRFGVVINTNGYRKIRNKQVLIDLWHGMPIKSMLYMEDSNHEIKLSRLPNMDFLITNSKMESTLLGSCMFVPFYRHRVLGSPRLDFLLDNFHIKDYLKDFDPTIYNKDTRYIVYMPTFRKSISRSTEGSLTDNIFNFKEFDSKQLSNFLKKENIVIVLKIHPLEMKSIEKVEGMYFSNNEKIEESKLDFYQMLQSTDGLISDYSSVMYDYQFLEKPILKVTPDDIDYGNTRGFLYEPYDHFILGDRITTQNQFEHAIMNLTNYSQQKLDLNETDNNSETNSNAFVNWLRNEVIEKRV